MTRSIDEVLEQPAAFLVQEVGGYFARDTGVVSSGAGVILPGTVLGRVTSTGEYVPVDPAAADGSAAAVAIALVGGDATTAAVTMTLVVRSAEIFAERLVFADTVTDPQKTNAIAELAALGMVSR